MTNTDLGSKGRKGSAVEYGSGSRCGSAPTSCQPVSPRTGQESGGTDQ